MVESPPVESPPSVRTHTPQYSPPSSQRHFHYLPPFLSIRFFSIPSFSTLQVSLLSFSLLFTSIHATSSLSLSPSHRPVSVHFASSCFASAFLYFCIVSSFYFPSFPRFTLISVFLLLHFLVALVSLCLALRPLTSSPLTFLRLLLLCLSCWPCR